MKKFRQNIYNAKRLAIYLYNENITKRDRGIWSRTQGLDEWDIIDDDEISDSPESSNSYDTHDMSETVESSIITRDTFKSLVEHFPLSTYYKKLHPIYRSSKDGYSLSTLYRKVSTWSEYHNGGIPDYSMPCVLLVKDTHGHCFGAYCTHLLQNTSKSFIGTGETKLFKTVPRFQVYTWTGSNHHFLNCGEDYILIGGSEKRGFGLMIDKQLLHGTSMECETFANDILSEGEDFTIADVEVWGIA